MRTLDFRGGSRLVALALVLPLGCSDDGVPQDEAESTATSEADPTTNDPSTSSPTGTTTSSTDSSTTSSTETTPGTSPTDTTDEPTGSSSSPDSSGTGTDTSDTSASDSGSSDSSSGEDTNGVLPTGADCAEDNECASGVCWDFSDYDQLCFGTACSVECASDDECVDAFEAAGAQDPQASSCGGDGRCSVVGTGFGAFACAMGPTAALDR